MNVYALRLKPGDDVVPCLQAFVKDKGIQAGCILSAVGSLTHGSLRFANKPTATKFEGHFEVVSFVGTLHQNGHHLHMTISDGEGQCFGGHVMGQNKVYTTLELVIGDIKDKAFCLTPCSLSGWDELTVVDREQSSDKPVRSCCEDASSSN